MHSDKPRYPDLECLPESWVAALTRLRAWSAAPIGLAAGEENQRQQWLDSLTYPDQLMLVSGVRAALEAKVSLPCNADFEQRESAGAELLKVWLVQADANVTAAAVGGPTRFFNHESPEMAEWVRRQPLDGQRWIGLALGACFSRRRK